MIAELLWVISHLSRCMLLAKNRHILTNTRFLCCYSTFNTRILICSSFTSYGKCHDCAAVGPPLAPVVINFYYEKVAVP